MRKNAFGARILSRFTAQCLWTVLAATFAHAQPASEAPRPEIVLNQTLIEQWNAERKPKLDADALIDIVLSNLPTKISVYPTEGYFYFQFMMDGKDIRGNIRFDLKEIESGTLPFMFYERVNGAKDINENYIEKKFSSDLSDDKINILNYMIKYKNREIHVNLYDGKPDELTFINKRLEEQYFGSIFDESGEKFDLIYNKLIRKFYYILNERRPLSELLVRDSLHFDKHIGERTGFVYISDPIGRKILVGVNAVNVEQNNFFDGPFDQIPDRTIDMKEFSRALIEMNPKLAKEFIPETVFFKNNKNSRYALSAYITYSQIGDMKSIKLCTKRRSFQKFISCLVPKLY